MPHHPLARAEVPGEGNELQELYPFSVTGNRSPLMWTVCSKDLEPQGTWKTAWSLGEPTTLWCHQHCGHVWCCTGRRMEMPDPPSRRPWEARFGPVAHHMSMGVEYSVDPSRTSGGRYHSVTTSLEYVFVGTDLALASPEDEGDGRQGAAPTCTFLQCCIFPREVHLPKSASLSSPLSLMSRFWGLRSRCRIFLP